MSDIVERLRAITETPFPSMTIGLRNIETITEAADEIERLRSEHDAWRDAAIEQQQKLKRSEAERQRQAEVMEEVRKAALEEAAKIAERCGRNNEDDWPGETWIAEVIAKEIRALSSEPEADHEAK